jgi:hypothetical protein
VGIHWYARSRELIDTAREFERVERCIVRPDADEKAIDAALEEREALFAREREARAELERRGLAVTLRSIGQWPAHVLEHVYALGSAAANRRFLDVLGWGSDYYIENLRNACVPMDSFSQNLDYLRVSPHQACALGEELMSYAARTERENAIRRAREAGLWLFFWGSVDCCVEAGQ